MRIVAALVAVWALAHATSAPVTAQGYGNIGTGPKVGELEIKAWQPIPKTKTAVQLGSDTRLGRELRRQVMIRLSQRGNEVGFSGSNVMRLDVMYFDLLGGSGRSYGELGEQPADRRSDTARLAHALCRRFGQGAVERHGLLLHPVGQRPARRRSDDQQHLRQRRPQSRRRCRLPYLTPFPPARSRPSCRV